MNGRATTLGVFKAYVFFFLLVWLMGLTYELFFASCFGWVFGSHLPDYIPHRTFSEIDTGLMI